MQVKRLANLASTSASEGDKAQKEHSQPPLKLEQERAQLHLDRRQRRSLNRPQTSPPRTHSNDESATQAEKTLQHRRQTTGASQDTQQSMQQHSGKLIQIPHELSCINAN